MGTVTTNFSLYKPASGETGWSSSVNANWDTIDSNLTNSLPRSYLAGCQLTNNSGSPLTKVDISAGQAQDNNNAGAMTLTAIIKDISAAWAVGTNSGGLATSLTLLANTWYHVFVIKRTDTNVVDAYFDSSVTAANIPTSYTLYRRIGSVKTNGSSQIIAFQQNGDRFYWNAPLLETVSATPGTSAVTQTLTGVPTGVKCYTILHVSTASGSLAYLSDLSVTDSAPSRTVAPLSSHAGEPGVAQIATQVGVFTNTSAQIRTRLSANVQMYLAVVTWIDSRGRDN